MRLSSFHGVTPVIVVFYPFAFTGVCTQEMQALREVWPRLAGTSADAASAGGDAVGGDAAGGGTAGQPESGPRAQLLAISCDTMFTLRVFAEHEELEFPMLSDFWPHGDVARRYGVFDDERGCAWRGSFVIDRDGVVRWSVVHGLPDARDVDDYVRVLRGLG